MSASSRKRQGGLGRKGGMGVRKKDTLTTAVGVSMEPDTPSTRIH